MAVRGGNGGEGPVPAAGAAFVIEQMWGWGERHLLGMLVAALVVSIPAFAVVAYFAEPPWLKALEYLGVAMGGVLLAIGAVIAHKRAVALEDAAKAQARAAEAQADAAKRQADANKGAEDGRRQERLKNAIEHLGHASDSVRLGGAYELFHLAKDTEDLRQTVLDILCAHIRRTTGETEYRKAHAVKPSEEIQSLLTLLFVQEHKVFRGCYVNLQGSWLKGAVLHRARLQGAKFSETHMQGVNFVEAQLQGVQLSDVYLQGVNFSGACLQGATLFRARLQGADLFGTQLQGADLFEANLQGAHLLQTQLQGVNLFETQLQAVYIFEPNLKGVTHHLPNVSSFAARIRAGGGRESDLSGATFAGGLSREHVDSSVKSMPSEEVEVLQHRLEPHIDKPASHELPEDSGAITGAYTAEEAERWIAEYEEAMGERPEAGEG